MDASVSSEKEQIFWQWFLQNQETLLSSQHTDASREDVFDRVQEALTEVDENLAFEFGPPETKREFIISAGGIQESFPAVLRLQKTQPTLNQWVITYFQPRREPISTIAMGDLSINSRSMEFSLLSKDTQIGLEIFIPGYDESDSRYKQIGYLFLDQALGEFDVEMKVFYLRFFSTNEPLKHERMAFERLPSLFDELYADLNGLTNKPS